MHNLKKFKWPSQGALTSIHSHIKYIVDDHLCSDTMIFCLYSLNSSSMIFRIALGFGNVVRSDKLDHSSKYFFLFFSHIKKLVGISFPHFVCFLLQHSGFERVGCWESASCSISHLCGRIFGCDGGPLGGSGHSSRPWYLGLHVQ